MDNKYIGRASRHKRNDVLMHYQEANGGASMNAQAGWEINVPVKGLEGNHIIYVKVSDVLKDNTGKEAWNDNGLMQRAIRAIKAACPEMIVMPDVALDPYSIYGHDGIIEKGDVANDATNDALVKMAVSHAQAGADFVAPSDMMDGRVLRLRQGLDAAGYHHVGIMS